VNAQAPPPKTFDIYVIDVEGGDSVLFVSPSGESLLMDMAGGGASTRDVDRVMDAIKDAQLTKLDHVLVTHWHGDHFRGLPELAKRIPIGNYIDHGPDLQGNEEVHKFVTGDYAALYSKATHTVVKPGDKLPISGLDWRIVTAAGEVLKTPLPGGGIPNPSCATFTPIDKDDDGGIENAMSVGSVIKYGKFRMAHFGDLTWNKEFELMCPKNPVGHVDLWIVSNHGLRISNSEVLVHGLQPRVAIMNDGTRKGGEPLLMKTIYTTPGFENLWEIHFSLLSGQEYTVPGLFIANGYDDPQTAMPIAPMPPPADLYVLRLPRSPDPPVHNGKAFWIKVSAKADGSFTVTNQRNNFSKTYEHRGDR
jgi:beta-lactamase superfamily II metal-dependent hydrolase